MPNFDREALRKGGAAIDAALASRGTGDFKPFLPNIYWEDDKDYRYVLFLTPVEESPQVALHGYVDCDDGRPHSIMARTDPSIGAKTDPIHDQWNYKPRDTNLAIAVELDPTMTVVKGREKPTGFEVATRTFDRAIRDDKDEPTDEYEEVTVPVIGLVAQSPHNFFNQLKSYDATENEVHSTPLKITRLGKKDKVTYNMVGYDVEVDRSGLVDYIDNLSYINDEEFLASLDQMSEGEMPLTIGEYLLYKRIEELADQDEYNTILNAITKPARFGDTKKDKKERNVTRKARLSQRRSRRDEEPEEVTPTPTAEAEVTKSSPREQRLARLKEKSKAAKQETEAAEAVDAA